MSLVNQVLLDARSEFMSAIARAIECVHRAVSQGQHRKVAGSSKSNVASSSHILTSTIVDSEFFIKKCVEDGNKLQLHCTKDVRNLIKHLFKDDELVKLGFLPIKVMGEQNIHSHRTTDTSTEVRYIDMYLLRPRLKDALTLKHMLQFDNHYYYPVMCLPDVSDMFPEVLQNVLGRNFTVGTVPSGNKSVKLVPCNVHMAPIEDSALSMFLSGSLEELYGDGDPTTSWLFAKAVEYLEDHVLEGVIPTVTSFGNFSKLVSELLIRSRRDYAADILSSGSDKSESLSDLSFMSERWRMSKERSGAASVLATEDDTSVDADILNGRKKMLGTSQMVDEAVFMDRMVDMVTPMCLNFTYEGILDDVFGIEQQEVRLPPGIIEGHSNVAPGIYDQYRTNFVMYKNVTKTAAGPALSLSSTLYKDIRWLNYGDAGKYLHQKALQVNKGYERGELSNIVEMGEFVKKFKNLQKEHSELANHVNLMSWISSMLNGELTQMIRHIEDNILQPSSDLHLEDYKLASITAKLFNRPSDPCVTMLLDLIYCNVEVRHVYRLLILLCQTRGGIKADRLEAIKKAIVYQYGIEQMSFMHNLEHMGLLRVCDAPDGMRWSRLCKKLNLLVDRETSVSDYSAVFGGYAPISLRLLQLILLSQNIKSIKSELQILSIPVNVLKRKSLVQSSCKGRYTYKLFGLIGGVTLGEVASIMSINRKKSQQIVLLTTNVVNAHNIINTVAS